MLRLQAGAISGGSFGDTIDDFGVGDAIDLRGLAYSGNATASFASGKLTVANGAMSVTLTLSDTPFTSFSLMDDGAGGTLVWGGKQYRAGPRRRQGYHGHGGQHRCGDDRRPHGDRRGRS